MSITFQKTFLNVLQVLQKWLLYQLLISLFQEKKKFKLINAKTPAIIYYKQNFCCFKPKLKNLVIIFFYKTELKKHVFVLIKRNHSNTLIIQFYIGKMNNFRIKWIKKTLISKQPSFDLTIQDKTIQIHYQNLTNSLFCIRYWINVFTRLQHYLH